MKRIMPLVLLLVFTLSLSTYGRANNKAIQKWNIPGDILGSTPNQVLFNQGAKGVWFFMEGFSTVHDPLTYRLLHNYTAPCDNWNFGGPLFVGIGCWESTNLSIGQYTPFMSLNFTDHPIWMVNHDFPARSLVLNASETQLAVVAWKSPLAGTINVRGSFEQFLGFCGNGIHWSVDKGADTLASGDIGAGGGLRTFHLSDIKVVKGESLYFTVDSLGDRYCDETPLHVTIVKSKK